MTAFSCQHCRDEKLVANSDDQEPWSYWASLPPGADLAVKAGLVHAIACPSCSAGRTIADIYAERIESP